jgi:hypothetical protein
MIARDKIYIDGAWVPSGMVPITSSVVELTTSRVPDPLEGTHAPSM